MAAMPGTSAPVPIRVLARRHTKSRPSRWMARFMSARRTYSPKGCFCSTSPPVAVAGKLIIGGAVNDNYTAMAQSGVIRAFDIDTGQLLWNWDSGNPDRTEPIDIARGETYTTNSPNSSSVFSADEELGFICRSATRARTSWAWAGLPMWSASHPPWWRSTSPRVSCAGRSGHWRADHHQGRGGVPGSSRGQLSACL